MQQYDAQYDLVVFGAGSGNSIIGPEHDDLSIAIVEEWDFGGTCMNRGCIPTKMLVHAADVVQTVAHAGRLGIDARVDSVRWRDIRDRVFGRIDPIAEGGRRYRTFECPNVTVHAGHGRFVAPRRIEVATSAGTEVIEGRQVVVSAGARPTVPDIPGLADAGFYTSDDIMRVDELPEHLIVIGGGFIACEMAHVMDSFGSTVTIVQRGSHLLKAEDQDISVAITAAFAKRFDLRCGQTIDRVSGGRGEPVTVHLADGSSVTGSHILLATGRTPNSDLIDAAAGGLEVHADGRIVVDEHQATSVPGVWALGDISSPYMLKHVANHEARVVAHNIVAARTEGTLRTTNHTAVPSAVFTDPQIASVGLTEMQAAASGLDFMVATQRYADIAYGWAMEDTTSFCKLIADRRTRTLIGAHIIGPHASSLIQQVVQAVAFEQTIDEIARGQYYIHPALSELVENALLQFPPPSP